LYLSIRDAKQILVLIFSLMMMMNDDDGLWIEMCFPKIRYRLTHACSLFVLAKILFSRIPVEAGYHRIPPDGYLEKCRRCRHDNKVFPWVRGGMDCGILRDTVGVTVLYGPLVAASPWPLDKSWTDCNSMYSGKEEAYPQPRPNNMLPLPCTRHSFWQSFPIGSHEYWCFYSLLCLTRTRMMTSKSG
jgi:hypothetical protein